MCLSGVLEVPYQVGTLETWDEKTQEPQEISAWAWSSLKSQTTVSQREWLEKQRTVKTSRQESWKKLRIRFELKNLHRSQARPSEQNKDGA